MSIQIFENKNRASTVLAAGSYSPTDVAFPVATGTGTLFPSPDGTADPREYFVATLQNALGAVEIVWVYEREVGDEDTFKQVARGKEGTTALSWEAGDRIEMRPTAGTMQHMLQKEDDTLTGDLNAGGNNINNPAIVGGATKGTAIQNDLGEVGNQLLIPSPSPAEPTIGGAIIWTQANLPITAPQFYNPPGTIVMYYDETPPAGWALCDGNFPIGGGGKATPDLRNRFVIGFNNSDGLGGYGGAPDGPEDTKTLGSTAGEFERTTSVEPDHTHTGTTNDTALTKDLIPVHQHRYIAQINLWGNGEPSDGAWVDSNNGGSRSPSQLTDWGKGLADGTTQESGASTEPDAPVHAHGIEGDGEHTHILDDTQVTPYIVLAYIIKLDEANQLP